MKGLIQFWILFILPDGAICSACGLRLLAEWYNTGVAFKTRDVGLLILFLVSLGCAIEAFIWLWGQSYIINLPCGDESKAALIYSQAISRSFAALPRYIWAMYLFRVPPFRARPLSTTPATGGPLNDIGEIK